MCWPTSDFRPSTPVTDGRSLMARSLSLEPDALVLAGLWMQQQDDQRDLEHEVDDVRVEDAPDAEEDGSQHEREEGDDETEPVSPSPFVRDAVACSDAGGHQREPDRADERAEQQQQHGLRVEQEDRDLQCLRL